MNFYPFTKRAPQSRRRSLNKLFKVMKLTALFLTIAILQVSAKVRAQKVTLNEKDASLDKIFKDIRAQTGYDFFIDADLVKKAGPVSITVKEAELSDVLNIVIQAPLVYVTDNNTVVVKQQKPTLLDQLKAALTPSLDVRGKVVDENGLPMVGVTITTKDQTLTTNTNNNGYFFLQHVNENAVLVISYVGYLTKEVNANADLRVINMEISNSKLDEVQVIAYGQTSQRLNTGDVTVVDAKAIEQQPVTNPLLALEGRVPGLLITQDNGIPGSGVTISIRGQNSIQSGNDPLYIIDGVAYPSQLLPGIGGILGRSTSSGVGSSNPVGNYGSPLSYINPSDIESISVLKDADATSIYGTRGANGVILITTKKGKAGTTKVDLTVQSGYGEVTRHADLLNTQQYLDMRNEAFRNDGTSPSLLNGDYDLLLWDTTRNTNWQKVLLGNTAHYTDAEANISGGNELTQFLIGGGYNRQTTVFPGDFADQKASLHFNINNTSANKRFTISLTASYILDDDELPEGDPTYAAYTLAPDAPALYNPDGSINWAPTSSGTSSFYANPIAEDLDTYQKKTNNLVANSVLSYVLFPGLVFRSSFGYTNLSSTENALSPNDAQPPEYRAESPSYSTNYVGDQHSWIAEPQLNYKKSIGKGTMDVLLGSTFEQNNTQGQQTYATGYTSNLQLGDLAAAAQTYIFNYIESEYKYNAIFGRINYNWNDEYLVDLTARRDGSSRFGADNEFHDFAAAGLGWIFTKEAFFTDNLPFLNYGKLRASYGTTGNDQIGDYEYYSTYSSVNGGVPYQGTGGMKPTSLSNPNLQWELTRKLEFGLETGFLDDRILLTASYSRNRTSNQLVPYNLPIITGYNSVELNFPATVQNTSWEIALNTVNIKTKDFNWSSNFNFTAPQNKLVAFPNIATSDYSYLKIGQPLNIQELFHFEGVDPATGKYIYASATDKFNPAYAEKTTLVDISPKFYGGFGNTISYKNFSLDFLFAFTKQLGLNSLFGGAIPGNANANQFAYVLNRWQKPGDVAAFQAFTTSGNNAQGYYDAYDSDAAYTDASYIRLKNLSLSWHINPAWVKAMHLQSLRVFLQGQNLLTITSYKGVDPETPGNYSLPPLRVLTTGIQVGL
jgi:TonB-linked SusC/RagA family outer membrane protein